MTSPKTFKRPARRTARLVKQGTAADAIGTLEHGQDTYILTFGQFSLIDALAVILDQTGPADVVISSWTAADAHLEEAANMLEAMRIRDLRMIVDRSFQSRQPVYYRRMTELFGPACVRAVRSHAKFLLVRNARWNVVVRTSMNLNENPRLENLEISEDPAFAAFLGEIVDEIFRTVQPGENQSALPDLPETYPFRLIKSTLMQYDLLNLPETTHVA
jgi:hypothetical protein